MDRLSSFHAAIFDLDGTLIDSMGVWSEIDARFLGSRGFALTPDYTAAVGVMSFREGAEYTIRRYGLSETPEELVAEWTAMVEDEYAHRIGLKPFVRDYLASLAGRGVALAVATASPPELYEPVLKRNGVYGLFRAFATVGEVKHGKGSPDVYLLAAERLGARPGDCVVFEDILRGVRSAKAAGMTAVGVYDSCDDAEREQIRAEADLYIEDFGRLLPRT